MTSLTSTQRQHLAKKMDEREPVLREKIRDNSGACASKVATSCRRARI